MRPPLLLVLFVLTSACRGGEIAPRGPRHEPAPLPIDINELSVAQRAVIQQLNAADPTPYLMRSRPIVCQIVETPNGADEVRTTGPITERAEVLVYALGEARDGRLVDHGWLEHLESGARVWEMTYEASEPAGGDPRNRRALETLWLEPGRYELHYVSDEAHAFGDWRGAPPERELFYGVAVFNLAGIAAIRESLERAGLGLDPDPR